MHKLNVFLLGVLSPSIMFFASCNPSVKGKWSDYDKKKFHKEMKKVKELSNLGELEPKFIDCYLNKCEARYESFLEADKDEKGVEILANECLSEAMSDGSVKGNWSTADKEKFRNLMATLNELENLGDNKQKWIECYLNKCEAKYNSFYEADQDKDGAEQFSKECTMMILSQ